MHPTRSKFLDYLERSELPLLSDGGMGTMLNAKGIGFEKCLDALNLSNPDLVMEIHQAYTESGSEIIQTNTFGANRFKLADHDLGDQVLEINQAGVEIARRAAEASGKEILIAGGVGPLGIRLSPYGR
ncbi:unnamed protein product, partial [marine sediment metagenome]